VFYSKLANNNLVYTAKMEKISVLSGSQITAGKTLLFLDEIQECPQAIVALRYFYEKVLGYWWNAGRCFRIFESYFS
jgi:predicted AAA+ superfamily ATPase